MDEEEKRKMDAACERCMNFLADMVIKYAQIIEPLTDEDVFELFSAYRIPA